MRRTNSVGGHRLYPSSPAMHEIEARSQRDIGILRDGMDRLHNERQLSSQQERVLDQLDDNSPMKKKYQRLTDRSDNLWQLALNHQRFLAGESDDDGPHTTAQLGNRMIQAADAWANLKEEIDS